jgi:hypothetical protein
LFITNVGRKLRVTTLFKSLIFVKTIAMIVERTKNEIIIRLPGDINIDELQDLSDWFQYKELTRKSKAKQKDVDALVSQIKKGRWDKRKAMLIK